MQIKKIISLVPLSILLMANVHASVSTSYLTGQKINLLSEIDDHYLEEFLQEYNKFPASLRNEIIRNGGSITLIQGSGVTNDPSWRGSRSTNDGRSWDEVPGSGGAPYARMPTRIVVNMLNQNHGSSNLFLHEHAHSLDSTYSASGVSSSRTWKTLMEGNPEVADFLSECGGYCNNDERERFAELFSLYHDSGSSRSEMESAIPNIAAFFANLTSVRNLPRPQAASQQPVEEDQQEETSDEDQAPQTSDDDSEESTEQDSRPWYERWFGERQDSGESDEDIEEGEEESEEEGTEQDDEATEDDSEAPINSGKPPQNNGSGKPPQDNGSGKPPQNNGSGKPPQNNGSGKPPQSRNNNGNSVKPPQDHNNRGNSGKPPQSRNNNGNSVKPPQDQNNRGNSGKPPQSRNNNGNSGKPPQSRNNNGNSGKQPQSRNNNGNSGKAPQSRSRSESFNLGNSGTHDKLGTNGSGRPNK